MARLTDGTILHVEFQTVNTNLMPARLKLYEQAIRQELDRDAKLVQVVVKVVGEPGINKVTRHLSYTYLELVFDHESMKASIDRPLIPFAQGHTTLSSAILKDSIPNSTRIG